MYSISDKDWAKWCNHQDKVMDMMINMSVANPPTQAYVNQMLLPTHQLGNSTVYSVQPVVYDAERERMSEFPTISSMFDLLIAADTLLGW